MRIAPRAHLVLVHQRRVGAEIGRAGEVLRAQPSGRPVVAHEGRVLVRMVHHRQQAPLLQGQQVGARQRFDRVEIALVARGQGGVIHRPENCGVRLPKNASMASRWSADCSVTIS